MSFTPSTLELEVCGRRPVSEQHRALPCQKLKNRGVAPFLGGAKGVVLARTKWHAMTNMKAAGRAQPSAGHRPAHACTPSPSWLRVAEQNMTLACTGTIMGSGQGHSAPCHRLHTHDCTGSTAQGSPLAPPKKSPRGRCEVDW
jgi:hypothetical protein